MVLTLPPDDKSSVSWSAGPNNVDFLPWMRSMDRGLPWLVVGTAGKLSNLGRFDGDTVVVVDASGLTVVLRLRLLLRDSVVVTGSAVVSEVAANRPSRRLRILNGTC